MVVDYVIFQAKGLHAQTVFKGMPEKRERQSNITGNLLDISFYHKCAHTQKVCSEWAHC